MATDTFTGTNGSAWASPWADGYTPSGGGSTIQSNTGRQTTGSATGYSYNSRISKHYGTTTDKVILVKFRWPANEIYARVWLRADTAMRGNNGYQLILDRNSNEWVVVKSVSFSDTQIGSTQSKSWSDNTWYWARFGIVGTTIRCRVWDDGSSEPSTWAIDSTDSSLSSGYYGLGAYPGNAANSIVEWDDYSDDTTWPSTATDADAEATSATGTAYDAKTGLYLPAGLVSGTGTAYDATVEISARGTETASATGTAQDATATISAGAETASGAGTAYDATITASGNGNAETATASGTAYDATVSANGNADAGTASATGVAYDATITASGNADAETASGTATAYDATADTTAETNADSEGTSGVGTAFDVGIEIRAGGTETASATGIAYDATVSVLSNAGTATAVGTVDGPVYTLGANAESPSATGTALDPMSAVAPVAGVATAAGTAEDATIAADGAFPAESTTATGTAFDPSAGLSVAAGSPSAAGTAYDTRAGISAGSVAAVAAGTAYDATATATYPGVPDTGWVTDGPAETGWVGGAEDASGYVAGNDTDGDGFVSG